MIIDKQEHKDALIELLARAVFPGDMIEFVYELKKSLENAQIASAKELEPA